MDFSFSRYLTELDHSCLSRTMALDNKLDCKSVTQQILNSVTPKHKALDISHAQLLSVVCSTSYNFKLQRINGMVSCP